MAATATGAPVAKSASGRRVGARASNPEKEGLLACARVESRPSRLSSKEKLRKRQMGSKESAGKLENVQELTKSAGAKFSKTVESCVHSVAVKIHDLLGVDYDGSWWGTPITMDTLEDAVREPDPEEVERLMKCGLDPNEPIDEAGHTVLDCLVVEQIQMLQDCQEQKSAKLRQAFFAHSQSEFFEVMDILQEHGAVMSGDERNHRYLHDIE